MNSFGAQIKHPEVLVTEGLLSLLLLSLSLPLEQRYLSHVRPDDSGMSKFLDPLALVEERLEDLESSRLEICDEEAQLHIEQAQIGHAITILLQQQATLTSSVARHKVQLAAFDRAIDGMSDAFMGIVKTADDLLNVGRDIHIDDNGGSDEDEEEEEMSEEQRQYTEQRAVNMVNGMGGSGGIQGGAMGGGASSQFAVKAGGQQQTHRR